MSFSEATDAQCRALLIGLFGQAPQLLKAQHDWVETMGNCLWDIFSDNHTVHDEAMMEYNLGSFRGTGDFIAEVIEGLQLAPDTRFDYLDFYMGSAWPGNKEAAQLMPYYHFIFGYLKSGGLDWQYAFPRMHLVSFDKPEDDQVANPETYNPADAIAQEMEREAKRSGMNEMQRKLDAIYEEAYEEAKNKEPAPVVRAYYDVYGGWPSGHPLKEV